MPTHKPKDGQDLLSISKETGVSTQEIMSCKENQDLFACRDPGVLFTEDEIWIPEPKPKELRVQVGHSITIVHRPRTRILHLQLRDDSGALRQTDYTLKDLTHDGTSKVPMPKELHGFAYQGIVHEELPAAVTGLTLLLEDDPDNPIKLELGRLDPVSTTRGLQARLQNLGLYEGELTGTFDSETLGALRMFQQTSGLPATGQADPDTRAALVKAHGS